MKLVVCVECASTVEYSSVHTHALTHKLKPAPQTRLNEIFDSLGCTSGPTLPRSPCAPIPGLAIYDGQRCKVDGCGQLALANRTMQDHFATKHPLLRLKDNVENVQLHRIGGFRGNQRLIIVDRTLSQPVPVGTFDDYLQKIGYVKTAIGGSYTAPSDIKFYDGFLAATKWHKVVTNHDISTLIALVSLPADAETTIKPVVREVKQWLHSIFNLVEDLDVTFLRLVQTAKGPISNTPFRKPQTEDYLDRCARIWARYLCMILRSVKNAVTHGTFSVLLSDDQADAARALLMALEAGRNVPAAISRLSFLLVSKYVLQVTTDRTQCPFYRFLVLFHMHPDGRFDQPHTISPNMSMLQLSIRATCVERGYQLVVLEREFPDLLTVYHEYLCKFLTEGTHHIFSTLLEQFHLVASFAYSTAQLPMMQWDLSHRALAVRGSPLVINDIKAMVESLFTSAEAVLMSALTGFEMSAFDSAVEGSLSSCDPTKWPKDDLRNQDVGYSFLHSTENPFASHLDKMLRDIYNNPVLFDTFHVRNEEGRVQPRPGAIHRWLDKVAQLTDLVFALSHILSAGPARGTELETYRLVNTIAGPRSFFFIMGYGVFVARYSKTRSVTGQDRLIPRFIPYRLTRLVVYLIGPLRVTSDALIMNVNAKPPKSDDLVFVRWGMPMCSMDFTQVLRHVTTEHLNLEMGLRDYRQVIKAVLRQVVNIDLDEDNSSEDPIDATFGHSSSTSRSTYGLTWNDMPHLTGNMFHDILKMVKRWLCFLGVEKREPSAGSEQSGQPWDEPLLKLSEAVTKIDQFMKETQDVAQLLHECRDSTPHQLRQDVLHRLDLMQLDLGGKIDGLALRHDPTTPSSHLSRRQPVDVSPFRVVSLRALFSDQNVNFKSTEQAQATEILARGHPHLLVVLRTGGGKTAAYMSQCFAESSGLRVVIIPYASLFEEMLQEAQQRSIAHGTWPSSELDIFTARLVFVRIERVSDPHFLQWLKSLLGDRLLRGIVIDESHDILLSSSYRQSFHALRHLAQLNVQIVMLTGMLGPHSEEPLCKALNIPYDTLSVIRQPTYRPEISYRVIQVNAPALSATIKNVMRRSQLSVLDRGLIFVMSVSRAHELANELNMEAYTGPMSQEDRSRAAQAWRDGKSPWLVCTLAFAQGINYPHVRSVITCEVAIGGQGDMDNGKVLGMVHLSQMAGRAGRDGLPASHDTIYISCPTVDVNPLADHAGAAATFTFITKKQCRRLSMTEFLDGVAVNCASIPGAQHCDHCLRNVVLEPHQQFYQSPTGSKLRVKTRSILQQIPATPISPTPVRRVNPGVLVHRHTMPASPPMQQNSIPSVAPPPPQPVFASPQPRVSNASSSRNISPPAVAGPSRPQPSTSQQRPTTVLPRAPATSHDTLQVEKPVTISDKRHYLVTWCASRYLKCSPCYFYDSLLGPAHQYVWNCGYGVVKSPGYTAFKATLRFTGTGDRTCYKCLIPDAVHETRTVKSKGEDKVICKYDDLLKPLLFLIYDDPDIRKHVFEELGIAPNQFSNMTQYNQWLGHSEGAADMLYNALEVILAYLHLRRNGRLPRAKAPACPPMVVC